MSNNWKCKCVVLSILVAVLFMIVGCGSHEAPPLGTEAVRKELFGKVWKLQTLFSRDVVQGDQPLTLEFLEDGTFKGFGGCNSFSGKYSLEGEVMKFGPVVSTKKSCGPATDEQEYTFQTFLPLIQRLKVTDDELRLYNEEQPEPMLLTTGEGGLFW